MSKLGEYIRAAREKKGLTQAELGKRLGLERQHTISKWERGEAPVAWHHFAMLMEWLDIPQANFLKAAQQESPDAVDKFAKYYHVDVRAIIAESKQAKTSAPTRPRFLLAFPRAGLPAEPARAPGPMRPVPLIEARAGQFPHRPWEIHTEEVIWTDKPGEHLFAVRVKGDSMEPEFHEGEIVLVNPDVHIEPGPRIFVLVDCPLDGDGPILKQFRKLGEQLFFHALNPRHEPQDIPMTKKHRIIGRVVRRQQDY